MDYELSRPQPVDQIDRKGKKITIEANEQECAALAKRFDLESLADLKADIDVKPVSEGMKYEVIGQLTATITQDSVISGDPVTTNIQQDISAWYADMSRIASFEQAKKRREREDAEEEFEVKSEFDDPEQIHNGILDLGEVTAQFLGLAIDEFPRGDNETEGTGDYIEVKPEDAKPNPFAVLAELKEKK